VYARYTHTPHLRPLAPLELGLVPTGMSYRFFFGEGLVLPAFGLVFAATLLVSLTALLACAALPAGLAAGFTACLAGLALAAALGDLAEAAVPLAGADALAGEVLATAGVDGVAAVDAVGAVGATLAGAPALVGPAAWAAAELAAAPFAGAWAEASLVASFGLPSLGPASLGSFRSFDPFAAFGACGPVGP